MTSGNVESTFFHPPNMQLGFSSKYGKSGRSGRTMALAEEIIDKKLELEMLQANVEADRQATEVEKMAAAARFDAEVRKKQAII